ncbi:hypothetical protein ACQVQY_29575 [Bacillus mycoides]
MKKALKKPTKVGKEVEETKVTLYMGELGCGTGCTNGVLGRTRGW